MRLFLRELGLACTSLAMASCGGGSGDAASAPVAVVSAGTSAPSSSAAPVPVTPTPAPTAAADRFDAAYYSKANPDVAAVYGQNVKEHYDKYGRWEGRLPYEGAAPWRPDASTPPADFAYAPACAITVGNVWSPRQGQVHVQFQLTRFGDGTPCERSYSIIGGVSNWGSGETRNGFTGYNISAGPGMVAREVLTLPSQGSKGELVINVPDWMGPSGGFHMYMTSAEYNPLVKTEFDVFVGKEQPAGTRYYPDALALPAPTAYPAGLGSATYDTDFLGDLASDGWTFWDMGALNGMSGAFTLPSTRTASGKLTDNYPIVTDGSGQRVCALVLRDHRSDPVGGKALFSSPMISRLLGRGGYGYRMTVQTLPAPMKGTDAALWGIRHGGGWPPEFDTHEGFAGDPRVYQTVHMPNGYTTSSTPRVDIVGKHEWMEEFGRQTYRLWIDRKLVVERPNYLAGEIIDTTFSIEGPGGAGGAADFSLPYDGLSMLLYRQSWWQR